MRLRRLCIAALLFGSALVPEALAQPGSGPVGQPLGGKVEEKRFTIKWIDRPWREVFEWLADQTEMPVVVSSGLVGTFTVVSPDKKRQYTLPEVIDLLNEGLASQKFVLVRRAASWGLILTDEPDYPRYVQLIKVQELPNRGRTELVRVLVPLKTLDAKEALPTIQKLLGPFGHAVSIGNSVLLLDTAGNLRQILEILGELDNRPLTTEVIPLVNFDAARTVEQLRTLHGEKTGGPALVAETTRNLLIVRGTREQILEIKTTLGVLDTSERLGNMKIITLEAGSAATLAEALGKLLEKMRPNPVRIILPAEDPKQEPAPKNDPGLKKPGKQAAREGPTITLTAFANKLIITCEDPHMMALARELVRLLTSPNATDFEVIVLRHASAQDAAKVIDELFNGSGAGRKVERVRVVADPATNALLIKATPLDLLTIRQLLSKSLDMPQDADPQTRTWTIGPLKHLKGAEAAKVLREVYRDEAGGKQPALTIGVDERTNSLILRCSAPRFEDIRAFVQQLDVAAPKK